MVWLFIYFVSFSNEKLSSLKLKNKFVLYSFSNEKEGEFPLFLLSYC